MLKLQGLHRSRKASNHNRIGQIRRKRDEIPKIKEQKAIDKLQPDTAHIYPLQGEPENWKNHQRTELTGKDGKDLFNKLSDEELDAKIEDLEGRLNNEKPKK